MEKVNKYTNFPTLVTMLYDIRCMENKSIESNRKMDKYLDLSKQFLLQLPFPIIFFIDENKHTYNTIYNTRKDLNLLQFTYIYIYDIKKTYFYQYLEKLEELQNIYHIRNGDLEHETPLYIILNNNKFDFIDTAIDLNPFNSSHFAWIDFGINHVSLNNEAIFHWIFNIPDKVKQLCINPYTEDIPAKNYFEYIYHNTAGGLFSGSIQNMKKYSELFKKKTEEIYCDNWYQIDEAVMAIVQKDNPLLFDLFYGDYQGIISNYLSPIHNIELIMQTAEKYLNYNDTANAYKVACYCIPFFEKNIQHYCVYRFINLHLITDYYHNEGKLLDKIMDIIQNIRQVNYERILDTLKNNLNNIIFYVNKEDIVKNFDTFIHLDTFFDI
jgi:hypothetical protein